MFDTPGGLVPGCQRDARIFESSNLFIYLHIVLHPLFVFEGSSTAFPIVLAGSLIISRASGI